MIEEAVCNRYKLAGRRLERKVHGVAVDWAAFLSVSLRIEG